MYEETFRGIPRDMIPWYPTVDYSKCARCGKCVDYCKLGVYRHEDTDDEKRPRVIKPNNCVVLCEGCQEICPSGAITHPSRKDTVDLIRKIRKERI